MTRLQNGIGANSGLGKIEKAKKGMGMIWELKGFHFIGP